MPFPFFAILLQLGSTLGPAPEVPSLEFRDFLAPSSRELKLSDRLLGLKGQRVRIVGYMALMEIPPRGAFYLCARPVFATEAGAGTADLPPDAVRVVVSSAAGEEIAHIPRPLEVTGTLEVGRHEEADGQVSFIRLILERRSPPDIPPASNEDALLP